MGREAVCCHSAPASKGIICPSDTCHFSIHRKAAERRFVGWLKGSEMAGDAQVVVSLATRQLTENSTPVMASALMLWSIADR